MMIIVNGEVSYEIGDCVARAGEYNLYLSRKTDSEKGLLLQIAREVGFNGQLDRATYFLRELARKASEVEEQYSKVKGDPKKFLNYELGFPEVIDSFVCPEQGGRRINILAFRNISDVTKMVPIINIREKDRLRVDLKTSAWIMGKLLKMLTFAHSECFAIGQLAGNNILIEPEQHYVVLFDWSATQTYDGEIPEDVKSLEISMAAKSVITILGGNPETDEIPNEGDEASIRYIDFLLQLKHGDESDALNAHRQFYKMLADIGWKGFHPFTTQGLSV